MVRPLIDCIIMVLLINIFIAQRTTYDPVEKKHWLAVKVGPLSGQYLLQDNMKPAWHTSKESTPKKIQLAVDEMIQSIDQISTGKIADLLAQATSPPSAGKD